MRKKTKITVSLILVFSLIFTFSINNLVYANEIVSSVSLNDTTTYNEISSSRRTSEDLITTITDDSEARAGDISFGVKVLVTILKEALGAVVNSLFTDLYNEAKSFVLRYINPGGSKGIITKSYNSMDFDPSSRSNYVGNGYTNSTARVKDLQNSLKQAGYDPGPIDGIWGPSTRSALISMQRNNGLTADGICGVSTWNKLFTK